MMLPDDPALAAVDLSPDDEHRAALDAGLAVLDRLLGVAVDRQARLLGPATLLDPWRGMHVTADDVRSVLAREAHVALGGGDLAQAIAAPLTKSPRIVRLLRHAPLNSLELASLLVVAAPDLDLRYEQIYAYLQDDVARKRAGLDLLANLFCTSAGERLAYLRRFDRSAPLRHRGIVAWHTGRDMAAMARPCEIAPPWLGYLLGQPTHDLLDDSRVRVETPSTDLAAALIEPALGTTLRRIAARGRRRELRLHLHGPSGSGKHALAQALAGQMASRLHALDLSVCESVADAVALTERALVAAALDDGVLYVRFGERWLDGATMGPIVTALGEAEVPLVVASTLGPASLPSVSFAALPIMLGSPSPALRESAWRRSLAQHAVDARPADIKRIAIRYRLTLTQIERAAATLGARQALLGETAPDEATLAAQARAQGGGELAELAERIQPQAGLQALVASTEVIAQLCEIRDRLRSRPRVAKWTDGSLHTRQRGVTALFAGPSGTGKTLAAEVIAKEVGFDLFRVDLAGVVSKYIGETEKNLDRVFSAAAQTNAVLFFDEADSLFGKRSEVKDAHDRYANLEISYLLQKMERFDGLAILATNLKQNLDDAFTRRLAFSVNFAFPEEAERLRLWSQLWPARAPRARDVDLAWFAREYRLSGGNIRNVIVAAAHLAADEKAITRAHLLHTVRREFQKVGKTLPPSGFEVRAA